MAPHCRKGGRGNAGIRQAWLSKGNTARAGGPSPYPLISWLQIQAGMGWGDRKEGPGSACHFFICRYGPLRSPCPKGLLAGTAWNQRCTGRNCHPDGSAGKGRFPGPVTSLPLRFQGDGFSHPAHPGRSTARIRPLASRYHGYGVRIPGTSGRSPRGPSGT